MIPQKLCEYFIGGGLPTGDAVPAANGRLRWHRAKWIAVVVLTVAALAKAYNAPEFLAADGLLSNQLLLRTVIFGELACAVCIGMLSAQASWLLTLVVFCGLTGAASYATLTGQSCNCFGHQGSFGFTLAIDIGILIGCLFLRPTSGSLTLRRSPQNIIVGSVLTGLLGLTLASYRLARSDQLNPIDFLLADTLVQQPWPLDHRFAAELLPLENGRWLVIVVRADCSHCRELLATHFTNRKRHRARERTAMFIAAGSSWGFIFDEVSFDALEHGSILWENDEPFVASPAVFIVKDGRVVAAADGNDADTFLATAFGAE